MEILVAKSGGFCRGVKKAVDTALAIEPENTYIFGEIIHNREVVDTITERGIVTVETLSAVSRRGDADYPFARGGEVGF